MVIFWEVMLTLNIIVPLLMFVEVDCDELKQHPGSGTEIVVSVNKLPEPMSIESVTESNKSVHSRSISSVSSFHTSVTLQRIYSSEYSVSMSRLSEVTERVMFSPRS